MSRNFAKTLVAKHEYDLT